MGFLSRFRKPSADDPPAMESWPLFAFGKLPVYKDFISAGLTDDVSREFRDWLSNGFSRHWSSRDDCRSEQIPLHAFLLRLPQSRKLAVGALWGSTDQGGLRKFPFALFTILPAGKPAASVLTALDYLPVFENRAREIRRKYDAGGTLAAVYQELRGATIQIPVRKDEQIRARLAEALARARVGDLATALFGDDAAAQWASLISSLDAAARSPTAGPAAFRFPLADETAPLHQLQLWTVRLTKGSPAGAAPTGVLYRIGGDVPSGVIFFRDARAEDILLFHPAAIPTDFVEEIPKALGRAEKSDASEEKAPARSVTPTPDAGSPPSVAPTTPAAPNPPEPPPPAPVAPSPEGVPPGGIPPAADGVLRLGAAAKIDVPPPALAAAESASAPPAPVSQPAPEPEAPSPASDASQAPEPPGVLETPPPSLPSPSETPAKEEPSAPAPAEALPAEPPPVSPARTAPAGWDSPLATLLEGG